MREFKVGLLVVTALVVGALGIFLIGGRNNVFAPKNHYSIHFKAVSGLATDNPVQLNGVTVGKVDRVVLPEAIEEELLTVWISVEQRFGERIREDSVARIKTLGLLGDKYIDVTSGSQETEVIPSGGSIPTISATDVDSLIASGEDVVENVVSISSTLRIILERMEAGEGLLGDLVRETPKVTKARESLFGTIESIGGIAQKIETGQGTLGTLVNDRQLASRIEELVTRLESVTAGFEEGQGPVPALLHDAELKATLVASLENFSSAAAELSSFSAELKEGTGLLQKLLTDGAYADTVSEDLRKLLENLESISHKLDNSEGTLGQIINDRELYEALDDVVVGVNESKLLRWLIRNRQKKGIKKRYNAAQDEIDEIETEDVEAMPSTKAGDDGS